VEDNVVSSTLHLTDFNDTGVYMCDTNNTNGEHQFESMALKVIGGMVWPNIYWIIIKEFEGAVDCEFEHLSGQTKDYKICICCFSWNISQLWALNTKKSDNIWPNIYWIIIKEFEGKKLNWVNLLFV
jgi:hypothetical protein